jgi:uncharacterized protein YggE
MKSTLLGLLFIATLLLVPATSYGAPPTQEATSEPTSSITVLGYGTASAAPDSVRVNLYVGEEPTYGPGGPEMSFVEPADLEHVRDFLVEEGIDEDTIKINPLSRNYAYGPSSFAGEVAFTFSELDRLRALLQGLVDEMKSRRGPAIQGANIVFRVEDCASLEGEAMRDALSNARQRATRMAGILEMSPGRVIFVSEDVSPVGAVQPAGGCIAHEEQTSSGGYFTMGGSSSLANSPSEVEVAIMLKVTFALEP